MRGLSKRDEPCSLRLTFVEPRSTQIILWVTLNHAISCIAPIAGMAIGVPGSWTSTWARVADLPSGIGLGLSSETLLYA